MKPLCDLTAVIAGVALWRFLCRRWVRPGRISRPTTGRVYVLLSGFYGLRWMIHISQATAPKAAIETATASAVTAINAKILIIAAFCQVFTGASCVKQL
jgi:hypothetical protein